MISNAYMFFGYALLVWLKNRVWDEIRLEHCFAEYLFFEINFGFKETIRICSEKNSESYVELLRIGHIIKTMSGFSEVKNVIDSSWQKKLETKEI